MSGLEIEVEGRIAPQDLHDALKAHTPIKGGRLSLECVVEPSWRPGYDALDPDAELLACEDDHGNLRVTLRLIQWSAPGPEAPFIEGIKEQELVMVCASERSRADVLEAYVAGWAAALGEALEGEIDAEWLMPNDLCFPRVLALKRPQSAEDFQRAFSVRSRLGRLVGG